jgi:hypothetical protein
MRWRRVVPSQERSRKVCCEIGTARGGFACKGWIRRVAYLQAVGAGGCTVTPTSEHTGGCSDLQCDIWISMF